MKLLISIMVIMAALCVAYGQDFVKVDGAIQLSGMNMSTFDGPMFLTDGWAFDTTSYSMTASQSAFLKDNAADGRPIGNVTKKAPLRCGEM